jgi:Arc/MetJ-type ribon-helix-helix transcriptional regulator
MDVRLKPELRKFVEDAVRAGHFATPDEVIEAGLARPMLDPADDEADNDTSAAIAEAKAQLDRGEGIPLDKAFHRLRKKHGA